MSESAEQLLQKAMVLSEKERAAMAGALLDSLHVEPQRDVDAAWDAEVARRIRELDTHAVETVPWSTVRGRLSRGFG